MKQPNLVRDRLFKHLHELRIQLTQLPELEHEALMALGGYPYSDPEALTETVNVILRRLGHDPGTPKEPRFDKTRRALAKKMPKRLRGVSRSEAGLAITSVFADARETPEMRKAMGQK